MKNKRGSHVDFAIAFVLFIAFVIFLFSIMSPLLKTERAKNSVTEHLSREIIEQASANLTFIDVAPSGANSGCLEVDLGGLGLNNLGINVNDLSSKNFSVKDISGNKINFELIGTNLELQRNNENFFKVFISDAGFNSNPILCSGNPLAPSIGLIRKEKYVFENKFEELSKKNYDGLKIMFSVSEDFSFSLLNKDKNLIKEFNNPLPEDKSAYAQLFPVTYVDENADRNPGYIKVVVW